jgi:hypothetical protein
VARRRAVSKLPPPPPPPDIAADALVDMLARRKRGRPKGSRNRATVQREQALAAAMGAVEFGEPADSIALLRAVMRSPAVPLMERVACAKILAQFDAPRLAPAPPPKPHTGTLAERLDEAFKRMGMAPREDEPTDEQRAENERWLAELLR